MKQISNENFEDPLYSRITKKKKRIQYSNVKLRENAEDLYNFAHISSELALRKQTYA